VSDLRHARLYFVTDAATPTELLRAALDGGVDMVQLRDPAASDAELLSAAERFRTACDEAGALLWLNDRPDLALAAGADGVHVGQDDDPVAVAREAAGPSALVGLSTHTAGQFDAGLEATGAGRPDQISAGPVWETPTKAGRPAAGLELIAHAATAATEDVPWFAIGGIEPATVGEVVAAGARRAVVVRAIRDATDPEAAARELRAALTGA
jgi:thiamine-phosphate pyrophosphorylase